MKTHFSMFLMIALVISGCAAKPALIPTPSQIAPTPTLIVQQPTTAVPMLITATNTATPEVEVIEPTVTTQPTATAAGLIMEIVGGSTQVNLPLAQVCQPHPQNWVAYTVQAGDTLSSLAQRTGTSLQHIQSANCLTSTTIFAGQILLLPFIPAPPIVTMEVPSETPKAPSPGDPHTEVEPGSGPAGSTFIIKIRDFDPLSMVTIKIEPVSGPPVSTFSVTVDANGGLDVAWVSPSNLASAPYRVRPYKPDGSQGRPGTILITQSTISYSINQGGKNDTKR